MQRADRPYATFYVSVTSETMTPPQLSDYLSRQIRRRPCRTSSGSASKARPPGDADLAGR